MTNVLEISFINVMIVFIKTEVQTNGFIFPYLALLRGKCFKQVLITEVDVIENRK